jgi:hypothetical protein
VLEKSHSELEIPLIRVALPGHDLMLLILARTEEKSL